MTSASTIRPDVKSPRVTTDPLFGNTIAKMQQFDGGATQRNPYFRMRSHKVNNHGLKIAQYVNVLTRGKMTMIEIATDLK